jgi:DNA-binding NarL/FixJ family response regulator
MKASLASEPSVGTTTGTPTKQRRARVLLVDDHPIIRERLAELINQEPDLVTCGEAEDAFSGLEAVEELMPNIVIVDLSLKDTHGIELIKDIKLRQPELPVLVLSMHDESLYAERAIRAGARGYITKQEATKKVMTAIRRVLAGDIYVSDRMAATILHRLAGDKSEAKGSPLACLTDRELEIFHLLGEGIPARQIAKTLHVSVKTVEAHREHIKAKLNFKTSAELLRYAIQNNMD